MSKRKDLVATDLARAIWRTVAYCENCQKDGSQVQLQGAHIFGVGAYPRLRDDLRNGLCLCSHCHRDYTDNPIAFTDWIRNTQYAVFIDPLLEKNRTFTKRFWVDRVVELKSIKLAIESGEMTLLESKVLEFE